MSRTLIYGGPERRQQEERREKQSWHVGKEIPLALILAVVVQTAGFVWKFSELSSKVDVAVATLAEFKGERYTREDARRDRELSDQKLSAHEQIEHELDRRMTTSEARLDRLDRLQK